MAEIKIEKKKPIWPWVILVLVILAILYFLVFANDDDDDEIDDMDDTEQIEEETIWEDEGSTTWEEETDTTEWDTAGDTISTKESGVQSYFNYISDKSKMGVDHEYTNMALVELMHAVQARADEIEYDISADMAAVKNDVKAIEDNPSSNSHASSIKNAGTKLAGILQKMQQDKFPDLSKDVEEMKTAAQNINASLKTLEQKDRINKFFNEAADILRKMS